jgi:hypothetical protein
LVAQIDINRDERLSNDVIYIEPCPSTNVLSEHRTDAVNYFADAVAVTDHAFKRDTRLINVWCRHRQKIQSCSAIVYDCLL